MSLNWKDKLTPQIEPNLAREIDAFEAQIALRKLGKIDEKVFAETRLRRGAYGQRYDNGKRHDGLQQRDLPYPGLTKGPDTFWDAPGMLRIKIPYGSLNSRQMEVLADLAEEYSDHILHVTTRQDIQLHYVHIDDTPEIFRRLAAVGITTREACGNSVRNVTACPRSGVCRGEGFDVSPYAKAVAYYLLGHPDTQDFGRKFKIAFSGCKDEACALVSIHDLGGIAKTRIVDGKAVRGFELYVGGGLGAVPHQAKMFDEFVPEEELLPLCRATGRVFARLGEKKNRQKARLKFVVAKLGIDEFKRLVLEEQRTMPEDPSWRKYFDEIPRYEQKPNLAPDPTVVPLTIGNSKSQISNLKSEIPNPFAAWAATNVYAQRQPGYSLITVILPLGDATPSQFRALADLARKCAGDNVRTTIEQNLVLRWIPNGKVAEVYAELQRIGLAAPGAGTIVDIVSCPGTDTCKLGIASSRGLAGELRTRLAAKSAALDEAVKNLHIKISGCFNSCGQHHVADIGFFGNSRNIGGFTVPHFQVILGGRWRDNGGSYGLMLGSVPSKRIPDLLDSLTAKYISGRHPEESFQNWCQRIGKKSLKEIVDPFVPVPAYAADPTFYSDWGDPRQFSIGDMAMGECAGEVVSLAQFGFTAAESEAFESQLALAAGHFKEVDDRAYKAMLIAARTLVQLQWLDVPADPATVVNEFRTRYVDTKIFWDPYAHGQFGNYLFTRHEGPDTRYNHDTAGKLVQEASLFIDAAHKAHAKYRQSLTAVKV
ncbi:MAG: nitrite/sulfite reductase [Tepidisphaeraceae bacterium]